MTSRRKRATASVVTRKIAALNLLFVLAVPACSATPVSAPSTGPSMATPSTKVVTSAPPSSTPAASVSFDPALAAKLQADLEDSVTKLHYPALAAAVILPDGSSWSGAAGKADVASATPARPDTSFAVGSVTKTFIAALMLELAHDGLLSLDDPIATWLPQLAGDARFTAGRVTVRQILDHTSGIADLVGDALVAAVLKDLTRRWTPDELLSFVGDPTFAPGTDWAYSNTNYLLAGMVIERASGSTVASLLRRRILAPLGLGRTILQPQEQPAGPTAHGYSESSPGGTADKPVDVWDGSGLTPNPSLADALWTAGGIASTASDLARWAAALYGGQVLDPASLAAMLDFGPNAGLPHGGTYGLGAMTWLGDGGPTVGHAGGTPGFQSAMWYLAKRRATLVILTNTDAVLLDPAYQSLQRIVLEYLGA